MKGKKVREFILPQDTVHIVKAKSGDVCLISGTIYTARDQAHKRLLTDIKKGLFDKTLLPQMPLYYCGPNYIKDKEGYHILSCGPTTSSRMDGFSLELIKMGHKVMIGKGQRSANIYDAIKSFGAVYLIATGGAGAFLSQHVIGMSLERYPDLGPEAIYKLTVKKMPVIVAIDKSGNSVFK